MSRSPLMATLRRACRIAGMSAKTGIPADELLGILKERTSRRRLLQGGLALASAAAATTFPRNGGRAAAQSGNSPILVVGAGIAGLTAAYRLQQAGVRADIIEARNQVGGRMRSLSKAAGTPIVAELGAEFIDTDHTFLRSLAAELGFKEVDVRATNQGLVPETYYFQGRRVPLEEIIRDFAPLAQQMQADLAAVGQDLSYQSFTPDAQRLDRLSLAQYLEKAPTTPVIRQLLRIAYTGEYGLDPEEQSSLNLLFLIGTQPGTFEIYGSSDERYQIEGGNAQVPRRLGQLVADSIQSGTVLEAIASLPDGRYRVALRNGQNTFDRTYERILLTLPFTTLRRVQLNVDLPPAKRLAINTLGYGTNSKLITSYGERVWRTRYGSTANVYSDVGFQNTWGSTPFYGGAAGLVTQFVGGRQGVVLGSGSPEEQAQKLLPQLEQVFPGISSVRQGEAVRAYWPGVPYAQGSYSCFTVGQWTQFYGVMGERVGNLLFAGEHCSLDYSGYMEGACETGEAAAAQILEDLGLGGSAAQMRQRLSLNRQNRRSRRQIPQRRPGIRQLL